MRRRLNVNWPATCLSLARRELLIQFKAQGHQNNLSSATSAT
jgi:hypothetical protein